MNNLLRTLTGSQFKSSIAEADLKLLLNSVKEVRKSTHDTTKISDAFYDSLEMVLHDLRAVTMDNHDAEAFLKPVSKTDVPDYYEVIMNPMDFSTMQKKIKSKSYKSKAEFKDDLDLIWSNCFTYNATKNHPLRNCAKRLKAKAERLLKNVTDFKDRIDPPIPAHLSVRGASPRTNGVTVNGNGHQYSPAMIKSPSPVKQFPTTAPGRKIRRDVAFPESLAIVRTAAGMSTFLQLDRELDGRAEPPHGFVPSLEERLHEFIPISDDEGESSGSQSPELKTVDGEVGAKRKMNGVIDGRPRKRARTHTPVEKDAVELWWDAVQSDELIGNGLPILAHSRSEPIAGLAPYKAITDSPRESTRRRKKKAELPNRTLLYHMNNNIRTLRRVHNGNIRLAVLKQAMEEGGATGPPPDLPPENVVGVVDERPWRPMGSGIEMGEEHAADCLHWMGSKLLEHAGFQGASKGALDVLTSVTTEYLLNVGKTIRFLSDKFGNQMSAEEIILHTLFSSGTTQVNELEHYIKDEVLRYGSRLTELEKKIDNEFRTVAAEEAWDDEQLFHNAEDDEEDGEFVMGNFADSFGEDFLGLRELGIASEFGLSSLTIPKKLLKGKRKEGLKEGPSAAKPSEPPPPFPPPPPFVPLDSKKVDDQIGLLKPFYQQRFAALASSTAAPSTPPPPPGIMPVPGTAPPPSAPADADSPPLVLPDDIPTPVHTKIGPLGQIVRNAPAAGTSKKKSKAKAPAPPTDHPEIPGTPLVDTPKKSKGAAGTIGKKKKAAEGLPPVIMASA